VKKANDGAMQIPINEKYLITKQAELKKFGALLRKTQVEEPRLEDVRALRRMLEGTPRLWRAIGDLAHISMQAVLQSHCFSPGMRAAIDVGIGDIKKGFGYEDSPGPERMLIDQIIVSWLQLQRTQVNYERAMRNRIPIPDSDCWERRLSASHMRYLRACETLARVRKLSRPSAMQVNIGARQVNVAQTAKRSDEDSGEQIESVNVDRLSPPTKS
jgi:hypothetical protein